MILQTTDPYTTILKNQLQKTLDTVIGENQSAYIKKNRTILQTLSTIYDIIDMQKPLSCFAKVRISRQIHSHD